MNRLFSKKLRLLSFLVYAAIVLIYISLTFSLFRPEYAVLGLLMAVLALATWIWALGQKEKLNKHIATLSTLHPPNAFLFGYSVPQPVWNQWLRRNMMVNILFLVVIFLVGTPLAAFVLQLPESTLARNTDARAALYSSAFVVASIQMALAFVLGLLATLFNYYYQKKAVRQVIFFQNGIRIGHQVYWFDLKKYPFLQININALKEPAQMEIWLAKRNSSNNKIAAAAPATEDAEHFANLWKNFGAVAK